MEVVYLSYNLLKCYAASYGNNDATPSHRPRLNLALKKDKYNVSLTERRGEEIC